ncbi:MAG: cold shock domain-containing protein, partial [Rhizobiaceae bacterium]
MGDKASAGGLDAARSEIAGVDDAGDSAEVVEVSGAIKWFDVAKGYGFVLPDDAESSLGDVLLHVTCLRRDGFQTALEGARVVCLAKKGERGLQAFRIVSMD